MSFPGEQREQGLGEGGLAHTPLVRSKPAQQLVFNSSQAVERVIAFAINHSSGTDIDWLKNN